MQAVWETGGVLGLGEEEEEGYGLGLGVDIVYTHTPPQPHPADPTSHPTSPAWVREGSYTLVESQVLVSDVGSLHKVRIPASRLVLAMVRMSGMSVTVPLAHPPIPKPFSPNPLFLLTCSSQCHPRPTPIVCILLVWGPRAGISFYTGVDPKHIKDPGTGSTNPNPGPLCFSSATSLPAPSHPLCSMPPACHEWGKAEANVVYLVLECSPLFVQATMCEQNACGGASWRSAAL